MEEKEKEEEDVYVKQIWQEIGRRILPIKSFCGRKKKQSLLLLYKKNATKKGVGENNGQLTMLVYGSLNGRQVYYVFIHSE